jgi:hypothetical protein
MLSLSPQQSSHCLPVEPSGPGDGTLAHPLLGQGMDQCPALFPSFLGTLAGRLSARSWRRKCSWYGLRQWNTSQQGTVAPEDLLSNLRQVLQQMKPVGHLHGIGCSSPGTFRVLAAPVSADNFHSWMPLQPVGQTSRRTILEQVHHSTSFQVYQDGAVAVPLLPGPIIDPQHPGRKRLGLWSGADATQQGIWAGGKP